MGPIRKVVVASDFSEASDEAIRHGDAWARVYEAQLVVVHALPDPVRSVPVLPNRVQAWSTGILALQRQVLDALIMRTAKLTSRQPGEFFVDVGSGIPYAVLLEKAEELGADLLVVGEGAKRRFGGTAARLVRHAHCPVLVARAVRSSGRVLVATDFSAPAHAALEAAADYSRRCGAKLTALHCLEYEPPRAAGVIASRQMEMVLSKTELATLRDEASRRLSEALEKAGVEGAEPVVTRGRAAEAIVELARSASAELVFVGTSGWTGLRRVLLGSVAEDVVRAAPCSVLVVRSPERR